MFEIVSPITLFVVASVCVVLLAGCFLVAILYYLRAKEIAPLLMRKASLEEVIERLRKDIALAREELDNLLAAKVEANTLILQGEQAKQWLENNAKRIEDLQILSKKVMEECDLAKLQLEDVSRKVSEKQTELAELNAKLLAADEKQAKSEAEYRDAITKLEDEVRRLKDDVSHLGTERAALTAEKEGLAGQVAVLKDEREQLKAAIAKLEADLKSIDVELRTKADTIKNMVEDRIRSADAEIARRRKEFEEEMRRRREEFEIELQKKRESFAKDLETQTKELAEARAKQIESMVEEIKRLEARRDAIAKELAEYAVNMRRNEELKKENQNLLQELDDLRTKVESAKIQIAEAEAIKVNEANMWKDLERNIEGVIIEEPGGARPKTNAEEALAEFKKNLDDSGYAFNERTIKAFHTGLLCGGESPLVVLSGISGTGKSLLPELYAKAFGMNFLPVAVQPRWDGPQDVFGFYNHMERRFKATELSRLLWQFDRFNNPQAKDAYPDEDLDQCPMNIVLLDEMNLARVEYYFSELLSKLEIRNRVIDPREAEQRRAAEIELEYGASSVADADVARSMARRIYVDKNILFVGTMNEDESTQSLSSKVIDRSNVLRFGTPDSLKGKVNKQLFEDRSKNFISYDTWKKWAKGSGNTLPGLDDYIKKLKEALKLVDRGFGHRTETAIKRYVELYPGRKEDALADQIEMKILAKLNGVESDLISNKIKAKIDEVLHAIHDEEVTRALRDSLDSDSSFFTWKGVRR